MFLALPSPCCHNPLPSHPLLIDISELLDLRKHLDDDLDALLSVPPSQIIVDNAPPLHFGYSLGIYP